MRIGFFAREALRATRRSAVPSCAALATVLVTMLVLGVSIPASQGLSIPAVQATKRPTNTVRSRVLVHVYMKSGASPGDDARVESELRALPHVHAVEFVSKQTAWTQQFQQHPQAHAPPSRNPLPDSFLVTAEEPANVRAVRAALGRQADAIDPAIGRVWVKKTIERVPDKKIYTRVVRKVNGRVPVAAAALVVLLSFASTVLIANAIRLSLYAHRREVEVMRLVGATGWSIRWPFVIEGVIVGAGGALLALVILGVTRVARLDPGAGSWSSIAAARTIPFGALVAVLLAAGVMVSAVGSGLSLRRFLRV